jgi:hypothetical protein
MKKILLALLLLLPVSSFAQSFTPSLLPLTDSKYYLGTTTPSTNAYKGLIVDEICLTADSCKTAWPSSSGAAFAWTPTSWGVSTSTTLGFLNGFLSTASSTFVTAPTFSSLSGLLQGNGNSAITAITNSSTVGEVLRVTGASTYAWGALDLTDGDAITGALGASNGGTGLSSLGAGVATWLGTPSASNLRSAVTGTTGTAGNLVFSTSPTLSGVTTDTLDTGQGANELYDMDQNVLTTSNVIFANATTTNHYFPSAAVMGWDNSDLLLTHSTNLLTLTGGGFKIDSGGTFTVTGVTADFSTATGFNIMSGASPTVNVAGEMALDTTSGNLVIATTTSGHFVAASATTTLYGLSVASTSPDFISGGIIEFPTHFLPQVVTGVICKVDAGTSVVVNLSDGTNDTNTITCTTTETQYAITSNNSWTAYERVRLELGTVTGAVDYLVLRWIGYRTTD